MKTRKLTAPQIKVLELLLDGWTIIWDQSGDRGYGLGFTCAATRDGCALRVHPRVLDTLKMRGCVIDTKISPFCSRYTSPSWAMDRAKLAVMSGLPGSRARMPRWHCRRSACAMWARAAEA